MWGYTFQKKILQSDLRNSYLKYKLLSCSLVNLIQQTKAFHMRDRLNNLLYSVETEYLSMFHRSRKEGANELRFFIYKSFSLMCYRRITQGTLISRYETFWFGLFFGFSALLVIVIIISCWDQGLTFSTPLLKEILPIFRGLILIILYIWLLAWNVYGWTAYHVDYKLIFNFNYHYSRLSQVSFYFSYRL